MEQQLTLADKNRIKTPLPKWSDSDTPYNFLFLLSRHCHSTKSREKIGTRFFRCNCLEGLRRHWMWILCLRIGPTMTL